MPPRLEGAETKKLVNMAEKKEKVEAEEPAKKLAALLRRKKERE